MRNDRFLQNRAKICLYLSLTNLITKNKLVLSYEDKPTTMF